MEKKNVSNEEKFTKLEITPKPSVRVYHTPNAGRDYYTLSYYDEEGRRQRPMFPDRQTAEAEAEKLAKKLERRELPGLMVNGRERLIYERALEIARSTGLDLDILVMDAVAARSTLKGVTLAEAARFHVEHTASVISRTVAEVVEELVSDRTKNGRSPAYIRDLRTRLGNFAEAFKCPIASVGTKDIEAYLDSRILVRAASAAQRAADYIRGKVPVDEPRPLGQPDASSTDKSEELPTAVAGVLDDHCIKV